MKLKFHPSAQRDVKEIRDYYDRQSDRAGDRFFTELSEALQNIRLRPSHFHFIGGGRRRCNLSTFPFHVIYHMMDDDTVGVLIVRHHRRHPDYGLRRRWPADS